MTTLTEPAVFLPPAAFHSVQALAATFRSIVPAIANHLWQSTAVFLLAWLLTLLLRRNRPATRHAIWLAASLKFLVPFSTLSVLSGFLYAPRTTVPTSHITTAAQAAAQPFFATPPTHAFPQPFVSAQPLPTAWPIILLASIWLIGALLVLTVWCARWRTARQVLKASTLARQGRELTLLRSLESSLPTRRTLPLHVCSSLSEPGLFGVLRPRLIWPSSLSEHLTDDHIKSILLHELIHARRRDNLTATLHMLVQALFWFHPAVWYIETRLLAERELACDEAVIGLEGNRRIYAQGLIKASCHAIGSPLPYAAGFTGGGPLSTRITAILRTQTRSLTTAQKIMLAAVAVCTLAVPLLIAQANHRLEFEVASVRQAPPHLPERGNESLNGYELQGKSFTGGLFSTNAPLYLYLDFAYKITDVRQATSFMDQMPPWARDVNYTIEARAAESATADDVRLMMRSLLEDRFHLHLHSETHDAPALVLTLAHSAPGPQLHLHTAPTPCVSRASATETMSAGGVNRPIYCGLDAWNVDGRLHFRYINATPSQLTSSVGSLVNVSQDPGMRTYSVVDGTNFSGLIDFDIEFVKNEQQAEANHTSGPLFDQAFAQQLGLRITRATAPVTTLMIDHIEPPTPN
ncbi:M56 family metallopeptidase [Granulicella sp. S156]|uniref:M56 family metallopeptidase n=1 Tax=Granulicella sp. S156 TaxID=1747224 RepID=UPI00131A6E6C|nr:M56 family metallopeptidase [Granulicella sp. S156]